MTRTRDDVTTDERPTWRRLLASRSLSHLQHMPSRAPRMMWQNVEGSEHGCPVTHRRPHQYNAAQADKHDKSTGGDDSELSFGNKGSERKYLLPELESTRIN